MVRRLNIDGDGQGDLVGHGGEHRAVFASSTFGLRAAKIAQTRKRRPLMVAAVGSFTTCLAIGLSRFPQS
jgi:MOSC domain-containing protein YiiM